MCLNLIIYFFNCKGNIDRSTHKMAVKSNNHGIILLYRMSYYDLNWLHYMSLDFNNAMHYYSQCFIFTQNTILSKIKR